MAESEWIYAKTMPDAPHEYTLRRTAKNEQMFEAFVMHIRHHGYKERYGKTTYVRLNLDEWKYWTMGAPLKSTILINRAQLDGGSNLIRALQQQPQLPLTK